MKQRLIPSGSIIIGRNSVREVLRHAPDRVIKVITSDKSGYRKLLSDKEAAAVDKYKIKIDTVQPGELAKIARTDSHQSYIAVLKDRPQISIKQFAEEKSRAVSSLVLLLDNIQDPQNLGAILRAAECFSVDLVVYSKNKGVSLTPAVSKASVGASELLNIAAVSNLADVVEKLKSAGFWVVLANADQGAEPLSAFKFPEKCLIILGSEGSGAQPLLKKNADFSVYIEMSGKISSLNVSQAAAIMLQSYRRSMVSSAARLS